jgi:hypothetical protein
MANVITSNPWTLDTDVVSGAFPNYLNTRVKIAHIEFTGYDVSTDHAEITDRDGNLIWQANGNVDLTNVVSQDIGWVNGIGAVTLNGSNGKFLVYLRP